VVAVQIYVSEPPLDTLIEGARIAGIRGPERLPPTLAADDGKHDAEDPVDQAEMLWGERRGEDIIVAGYNRRGAPCRSRMT
jgi:hypothetical protein